MLFFDTETTGFHGPIVLIQYAKDDESIKLHHAWKEPINDTINLIEEIVSQTVCGFNLAYDWFHICQFYTTLIELRKHVSGNSFPEDNIDLYAALEPKARNGQCLKPTGALDLLLYARRGPYQSTMDRRNIVIKKVPLALAEKLIDVLEEKVQLKDIYFSRRKDKKAKKWQIQLIKGEKEFVNIVLRFAASSALKVLAADALGVKDAKLFKDVGVPRRFNPIEVGWAPFAAALSSKEQDWRATAKIKGVKKNGYAWPGVIKHHIDHWYYDTEAKTYGSDDVDYVRRLYYHFGKPEPNDTDSILACMVGSTRWRGFAIDLPKLDSLDEQLWITEEKAPKHPEHVYKYITEVMGPTERTAFDIKGSTKKVILEGLWKELLIDCPDCNGEGKIDILEIKEECPNCNGSGAIKHPAAIRAKECLDARISRTKRNVVKKLRQAGRFHVSTNVIGALSGRMSGRDGLNATGLQHESSFRALFTLAPPGYVLCGGDFVSFEVVIADAKYNDPELRKQLLTCFSCQYIRTVEEYCLLYCPNCDLVQDKCKVCKKIILYDSKGIFKVKCDCEQPKPKDEPEDTLRKIHGLFAQALFPGKSYDEILTTKGKVPDLYDFGKRGIFSQLYGGNYSTLMTRLGISEEDARSAELAFAEKYKGVGKAKEEIANRFCSMKQPNGIGTKVEWHDPDEFVVSLNGFKRYFTLENQICKILFDLAESPPEEWTELKLTCVRRDREQKIGGAIRSAIFASAFNIQSKNMRAAANHEIQSTGAKITKDLQKEIWELQPVGVNDWFVECFQVHDEVMVCTQLNFIDPLEKIVNSFVNKHKSLIPLIKIDWSESLANWSEK